MDKSKAIEGSSSSGSSRGRGQPRGAPTRPGQPGRGGRGASSTKSTAAKPLPAQPATPSLEGATLVPAADGSTLVIDKDGNHISTIYPRETVQELPAPADDFQVPARQAKKAKQLAVRKAREVENADFFNKGGTHELFALVLNKARQETSQARPRPPLPPGGSGQGRPNKRKRPLNPTPSGNTPPTKTPHKGKSPATPAAPGSYAAAAKKHNDRQRANQQERPQELNPHALHVHVGKTERSAMNKTTFDLFRKELSRRVFENATEQSPVVLKTEYTNWSSRTHAGVIACLDNLTTTWYKDTVDTIELSTGVSFRAWPVPLPAVGRVSFNANGLDVSPEKAVILIKAYNPELGLGVTTTKLVAFTPKGTNDRIIEIQLSDDAAAILGTREPLWKLNFGTDQRRVRYHGRIELAKRLQEAGHELYEKFRTTSLVNEEEVQEVDMEDPDEGTSTSSFM